MADQNEKNQARGEAKADRVEAVHEMPLSRMLAHGIRSAVQDPTTLQVSISTARRWYEYHITSKPPMERSTAAREMLEHANRARQAAEAFYNELLEMSAQDR